MDGYKHPKAYIATQGKLNRSTVTWPFHLKAGTRKKIIIVNSGMGPLHEAVTWCTISPAEWQATHWDIQNKGKSRLAGGNRFVLEAVVFFCHPA